MKKKNVEWTTKAKNRLKEIKQQNASLAACIKDGLTLIKH
jgi:hypothetical protein